MLEFVFDGSRYLPVRIGCKVREVESTLACTPPVPKVAAALQKDLALAPTNQDFTGTVCL